MNVIELNIDEHMLEIVKAMAGAAEIGGKSQIRGEDRQATLSEDQFIGQICECALYTYWQGHNLEWIKNRWYRNQNPRVGDNGSDMPPSNIDVKGSKIRTNLPLEKHHLLVRPREMHPNRIYILALVDKDCRRVYLLGWATTEMLPKQPAKDGVFSGAYVLPATSLLPLPPIKWSWA